MKLTTSDLNDVPQIQEWIAADPYHKGQHAEWWLTGNGLLSFCLQDDKGPLTFVRLEKAGEYVRIHTQFAPYEEVDKRRLLVGMVWCMEQLIALYRQSKAGMIFDSISPQLIAFMDSRFGFKSIGGKDYRLDFEVTK